MLLQQKKKKRVYCYVGLLSNSDPFSPSPVAEKDTNLAREVLELGPSLKKHKCSRRRAGASDKEAMAIEKHFVWDPPMNSTRQRNAFGSR